MIGSHALEFEESADTVDLIDAQRAVVQGGRAAGFRDPDGRAKAHVQGRLVHGLAIGDLRLAFQAVLDAARRLLEREVVTALDRAQTEEGDTELAVAELPPRRHVRLVILGRPARSARCPGLHRDQQRL